jgi:hypothetical protein
MDKNYSETIAINALISVLHDVVNNGNENPEFDSESGFADISDGSRHQPIILLDREDVSNLIPFLEEQMADQRTIDYFKNIGEAKPIENNKQG